jgi:shikimate kinase
MTNLQDRPVFLIGYRGTGKTAVARLLAEQLRYEWIDADDEVERLAGKTIAAIFAERGEQAFRDLEADVVVKLCGQRRLVVALGGGAVLREANRAAIRGAGPVIWLTAGVDTIVQRLTADRSTASRRPKLTELGGRAEIETLLAQRTPIYRACAKLEVDTDSRTPAEVADRIVTLLQPAAL